MFQYNVVTLKRYILTVSKIDSRLKSWKQRTSRFLFYIYIANLKQTIQQLILRQKITFKFKMLENSIEFRSLLYEYIRGNNIINYYSQ